MFCNSRIFIISLFGDRGESSGSDVIYSLRRNLQVVRRRVYNDPRTISIKQQQLLVDNALATHQPKYDGHEFPYPELQTFLTSNNLIIDVITGEKKFRLTLVYHIGMVNNWK